jgi:hypothetical protein
MRRTVVVTVVAVGVVALLVAGTRYMGLWRETGSDTVTVTLSQQASGSPCLAADPAPLGGVWKKKLTWNVVNNCTSSQYVSFGNYREHLAGTNLGSPEKIVDPDPAFGGPINPNGGTAPVAGRIDKWNWFSEGNYKYTICVGTSARPTTNCTDPDVDVWPVF